MSGPVGTWLLIGVAFCLWVLLAIAVGLVVGRAPRSGPRRCLACGCTDENACIRETAEGVEVCWWIEDDLCSACTLGALGAAHMGWVHPLDPPGVGS